MNPIFFKRLIVCILVLLLFSCIPTTEMPHTNISDPENPYYIGGGDDGEGGDGNDQVNDPSTVDMNNASYDPDTDDATISWIGYNQSVILLRSSASITEIPASGTEYTEGSVLGNSEVIYTGTASEYIDRNISEGVYYYRVYSFNTNFLYAPGGSQKNITAYDGAIYVALLGNGGNDANSGISSSPKATIQAAIEQAFYLLTTGEVRVAAGLYETAGTVISMVPGIDVLGGWDPVSWTRNTATFETIIHTTGSDGTVLSEGPQTDSTLDGFTINGSNVTNPFDNPSALRISTGASPVISNNIINGGTSSTFQTNSTVKVSGAHPVIKNNVITGVNKASGDSIAVCVTGEAAPDINNNEIKGGLSVSGFESYGISLSGTVTGLIHDNDFNGPDNADKHICIYLNNCPSAPDIYNNMIDPAISGGNNTSTTGILVSGCGSTSPVSIYNNYIRGGGGSSSARGIKDEGNPDSKLEILNNTIYGGDNATNSSAIDFSADVTGIINIKNNILTCGGNGNNKIIRQANSVPAPNNKILNNVFFGAVPWFDSVADRDVDSINSMTNYSGNISQDLTLIHFNGEISGPAAPFTTGGLDGTAWGFVTDKTGAGRTAPWSIGAFEYD